MDNQAPSMLKPALISGVAFGVAGAIPLVNLINCACCALIIGCGFFAAFLFSKDCRAAGSTFRPANGATVGLVSGLIYGIISGVLSAIINTAFGTTDWQAIIDQIQASGADIPPETLDQISAFMESSGSMMMVMVGLFFALLFGAVFGTLGGLIGGSVFKYEREATAVSDQAPHPPPVG